MVSRLLTTVPDVPDVPIEMVAFDVGTAAWQMYLAKARRDKGMISDKEMAVVERVAGPLAKRSYSMFNPFTGERKRVTV